MTKAPLADALEFLRIRSADLDTTLPEGSPGRGVNFVLMDPKGELGEVEISLTMSRVLEHGRHFRDEQALVV